MPFLDLRQERLAAYIDRNRDPDAFWFFLHIPKTAGSSFSEEMAQRLSPYSNIYVDYSDANLPFEVRLDAAVRRFTDQHARVPFHSASGHVPFALFSRIAERVPGARVVTFLREPQARVISDYRYQRTPMHPPHQEFIRQFPTLESYVRSRASHNKMCDFLGWRRDMGVEALNTILDQFTFIGLLEMYPMSFSCMFDLMGHRDHFPQVHRRQTPKTRETEVELDPALLQLIAETNADDQFLYDTVRTILIPKRDEWRHRVAPGDRA